ncbi:MAG: hypothetical protein U0136_18195 [Bdellovibrionota bacterium]
MARKSTLSDESLDLMLRSCGAELRRTSKALVETTLDEHRRTAVLQAVDAAVARTSVRKNLFTDSWAQLVRGWCSMVMSARLAFACVLLLSIALALKHPAPMPRPNPSGRADGREVDRAVNSESAVPEQAVPDSTGGRDIPVDDEVASAYAALSAELASGQTWSSAEVSDDEQSGEDGRFEDEAETAPDDAEPPPFQTQLIEPSYLSLSDTLADLPQPEDFDYEADIDDAA